ncbi:MAG: fasciclin domain-containing protein [Burkholderiales bacterium]|nr:fasciclin domain-containing protein [Burkholderiales bacterium]
MTVVLGTLKTMNGAKIDLSKAGDMVTIEKAVVTRATLTTTNGAVHIIDCVLMPPIKK